jgi:ribose transport system permease protein
MSTALRAPDAQGPSATSGSPLTRALRSGGAEALSLLVTLVLLTLIFGSLAPKTFLLPANIINIAGSVALLTVVALGEAFVILSGGLDISIGSIVGFASVVAAMLVDRYGAGAGIGAALAAGGAAGFVNGLIVSVGRINPVITTLGTLSVFHGVAFLVSGGQEIGVASPSFNALGGGTLLGIPIPVFIAGAAAILSAFLLRSTDIGRNIYALGGSPRAARLVGIDISRYKLALYTLSGLIAGLGAVILTARTQSGSPTSGSDTLALQAITAVVLGGSALTGGKGTILGVVLGVLVDRNADERPDGPWCSDVLPTHRAGDAPGNCEFDRALASAYGGHSRAGRSGMTAAHCSPGEWDGFPSLVCENEALRVTVVPRVGAKVVSLFDKIAAKEWLAPSLRALGTGAGERWQNYDCGGWDECVPNIAPGPEPRARDGRLRDHGDVWNRPAWAQIAEDGSIVSEVDGIAFTFRFARRISLEATTVFISYRLEHRGSEPFPWSWAMHPLLDATALSSIDLPAGTRVAPDSKDLHPAASRLWPLVIADDAPWTSNTRPPSGTRFAQKLYTGRLSAATARVTCSDARLTIEADPQTIPYFGIWLNYGGWPDAQTTLDHIAIEATTSNADVLSNAERKGTAMFLRPGEQHSWWIKLHCERSNNATA